jgi:hypothetical protein
MSAGSNRRRVPYNMGTWRDRRRGDVCVGRRGVAVAAARVTCRGRASRSFRLPGRSAARTLHASGFLRTGALAAYPRRSASERHVVGPFSCVAPVQPWSRARRRRRHFVVDQHHSLAAMSSVGSVAPRSTRSSVSNGWPWRCTCGIGSRWSSPIRRARWPVTRSASSMAIGGRRGPATSPGGRSRSPSSTPAGPSASARPVTAPQQAVNRTGAFGMYVYTIVVLWYAGSRHRSGIVADRHIRAPWYLSKPTCRSPTCLRPYAEPSSPPDFRTPAQPNPPTQKSAKSSEHGHSQPHRPRKSRSINQYLHNELGAVVSGRSV